MQAQFLQCMNSNMIQHGMDGDNNIWLYGREEAQESIHNHRSSNCFNRIDGCRVITFMKDLSIQLRIVANSRPIQLCSFAQGEAAVFLKHVNDFDTIVCRLWARTIIGFIWLSVSFRRWFSLLKPFFLLPLRNNFDGVADGVRGTSMPGTRISNQKQDSLLSHVDQNSPPVC